MGYPIRKFEKKDTEQVMRIWLDGNIETHGFVPEAYWMSHFPLVQEQLLQADLYVYEQSGTIQGFVGMTGDFLAGIFVDKSSTDFLIIFSNLRKCWKGLLYQAFPAFCVSEDTPHIMAFRSLTWR